MIPCILPGGFTTIPMAFGCLSNYQFSFSFDVIFKLWGIAEYNVSSAPNADRPQGRGKPSTRTPSHHGVRLPRTAAQQLSLPHIPTSQEQDHTTTMAILTHKNRQSTTLHSTSARLNLRLFESRLPKGLCRSFESDKCL